MNLKVKNDTNYLTSEVQTNRNIVEDYQRKTIQSLSPSFKRRLSLETPDETESSSSNTFSCSSSGIVSPSKLQKSQGILPSKNNSAIRRVNLGDDNIPNPRSNSRIEASKSSSTLLSDMLKRNAGDSSKKLTKMISTVHLETQTPEISKSSLKKYQSCVTISAKHPALSDEFYNSPLLTPAMRGSPSPDKDTRTRGVCGTRGLTPLSTKARASLLRSHGVFLVDRDEAEHIRTIRESRETCGCACGDICRPGSCECALNDIGDYCHNRIVACSPGPIYLQNAR